MKRLIPVLATLTLAACSWGIKLDSGGNAIRVAWNDDVGHCRDLGRITVSVLDRVGPVDRRKTKVNDELEVMARNEAATMRADTIKPLGEPRNGEQSWGAYACGTAGARTTVRQPERRDGTAETFPVRER